MRCPAAADQAQMLSGGNLHAYLRRNIGIGEENSLGNYALRGREVPAALRNERLFTALKLDEEEDCRDDVDIMNTG